MTDGFEEYEVHAGVRINVPFTLGNASEDDVFGFEISLGPNEDSPEWDLVLMDAYGDELWSSSRGKPDVKPNSGDRKGKQFYLGIECPKGARYGDTVLVRITCGGQSAEFHAKATQSIMILKTQMDQEKVVTDALMAKADREKEKDIYAVLCPVGLRGYVFVEGMNTDRLREKTRDIKKARNFIDGETALKDIEHYLVPVSAVVGMSEGDFVELVNGPFKGEKARVKKVDSAKEEITVELIDAVVPIPVVVKGDSVRVLEKES